MNKQHEDQTAVRCHSIEEMEPVMLHRLVPGRVAVIVSVEAAGQEQARLKSMGLCIGRRVQMVTVGDPLILRVLGSRIGLSQRLAKGITVKPCPHSGMRNGER